MPRAKNNYRRNLIRNFNLLNYLDQVSLSDRNKALILQYMGGMSFTDLAKRYGLTKVRIGQILDEFIFSCEKLTGREYRTEWLGEN